MPRPHLLITVLLPIVITSCAKVPPLQVTPQPRKQVTEAPRELPKVPPPDASAAETLPGYRVEVVLKDLTYPSSVDFDDRGNMYVAEAGYVYGDHAAPARIWRISADKGEPRIVAENLSGPVTDILWHQNRLYISHKGKISVLDSGGQVRDLVTDLPSLGDHHNNQLALGPDNKIYFGQGTATNSGVVGVDNFVFGWLGMHPKFHDVPAKDIRVKEKPYITLDPMVLTDNREPPLVRTTPFAPFGQGNTHKGAVKGQTKSNGTILRMNPDGSSLEVYAWGLRNPFGVAWSPDGNLYATDNGFDARGSRPIANTPDAIWNIKQNAWYGWPDFAAGEPVTLPKFKPEQGPQPEFILDSHPPVEKPLATRPRHVGVTKIDIARDDRFAPRGSVFFGEVGDMSPLTGMLEPGQRMGFDVVRFDAKTGELQPFFRTRADALGPPENNLQYITTPGPKRIVDVRFSPGGDALYVADIGAITVLPTAAPTPLPMPGTGVIWRITRSTTVAAGNRQSPAGPPPNLSILPGRNTPPDQNARPAGGRVEGEPQPEAQPKPADQKPTDQKPTDQSDRATPRPSNQIPQPDQNRR